MLLFLLLLDASISTDEATLLARQSGAPYVCYKNEDESICSSDATDEDIVQEEKEHEEKSQK